MLFFSFYKYYWFYIHVQRNCTCLCVLMQEWVCSQLFQPLVDFWSISSYWKHLERGHPQFRVHSTCWCPPSDCLPRGSTPDIDSPWNRKDELSNALIVFFKKERLCWTSSEVAHGVARNTTRMLTDALWFLDGHQATFRDRSCDIPVVFDQFANFNCPELSKHRKSSSVSLSSECVCVCCVCTFCACGYV